MAQKHLKAVARAAKQLEAARVSLRQRIREANLSGESVRDIAPYADLSPSRVQELLKEARQLDRQEGEQGG